MEQHRPSLLIPHPAACPDHRDVADMPSRTTRANLNNAPKLELTRIRSSLTALAQRLFAATDTSARGQESTRYFRSGQTVARHGIDQVRAGTPGMCSVETQPAGALGFWPSSCRTAHAACMTQPGQRCRTKHAANTTAGPSPESARYQQQTGALVHAALSLGGI
jgi:hypothetical protein